MKAQLICNGQTIEVEVSEEQVKKLFSEKKKTGYERAEAHAGPYWSITDLVGAKWNLDDSYSNYDDEVYENANYYTDKEVADNMAKAQRLWNRIHRRSVELCKPCYRWADGELYTIIFSPNEEFICAVRTNERQIGSIYFDTEEHCKQVIGEFREELMWYFTEFIDRSDM